MRWLLLVALLACRTRPTEVSEDLARVGPAPVDLAPPSGMVSCDPGPPCSIGAGEHCCDDSPLFCSTAPCGSVSQFDCDGPEDCGGGVCCFPNAFSPVMVRCAAACDGAVLCHAPADCPAGTVCCLNFVLGHAVGLCLGACD